MLFLRAAEYRRGSSASHRVNMLRGNRFRLVTLGRLTLVGEAGEEDASLARRRFKLALLAVLAMARRPLSRDSLLEMFWGDQDEARARHSLSNALSSLRRALGQRAITTRDTEVALASELPLDVDALELAAAVESRDYGRAIALYSGPFLEGVHVDDSPAFEQWSSRERRRLEALFVQACAQHCAMLARARRWEECGAVAARWIEAEPLSADAAIYLLNAAKAPGTRAALAQALTEYERIRSRLAREFELVPEKSVNELAERIREQLAAVAADAVPGSKAFHAAAPVPDDRADAAAVPEPPAPVPPTPAPQRQDVHLPPASVAPAPPSGPPHRPAPRSRHTLRNALAAGVVLGALLLPVILWRVGLPSLDSAARGRKPVIAVLAMDLRTTDSTLAWLADGLPQMIAGLLAHVTAVDVVPAERVQAVLARSGRDPRTPLNDAIARDLARRLGATLVAQGAVSGTGGNIVLEVSVQDIATGRSILSEVVSRNDALALADEAAVRILGAANVQAPGPQFAELETTSLDAYQRYMRALELGQSGRLTESVRELDAAIALDSGFITAVRARIGMAIHSQDLALAERLRETIRRHADRATEFDRLHQEAYDAYLGGRHEESEALARGLVRRYPRDPRAFRLVQDILGSHGRIDEAKGFAEQGLALDSLAIEAGSGPCAQCLGFSQLVSLHWIRGEHAKAAEWARRWIRAQPDGASAWASLAWTYSYLQRPDSALPLMQRAVSLSGGDSWASQEYARMLLLARRYDAADSAIATMEASESSGRREIAADLRVLLERERGRLASANRVIDRMSSEFPGAESFATMMRAGNLRITGSYAEAARLFESGAHAPGERMSLPIAPVSARAFCWHHALAADALAPAADTLRLRAYADTLQRGCRDSFYGRDWRLYHHVRGLIALRSGRYEEAERELRQAVWSAAEGWGRTIVELANAQLALGRPHDAIATLRTGYATRLDAMGRYVSISELDFRMAQAFAKAGESDSARLYSDRVRSAWGDADPEIRRLLTSLP